MPRLSPGIENATPMQPIGLKLILNGAVASIASMPRMYPHYDDDHRFAKIRAYPYLVIYEILDGTRISVVAVAYSGRRPGYWSDRT